MPMLMVFTPPYAMLPAAMPITPLPDTMPPAIIALRRHAPSRGALLIIAITLMLMLFRH
jgi:hypothetical protein